MSNSLDRLQAQLLTSGLQQKDPVLYQIINTIIKNLSGAVSRVVNVTNNSGGGGNTTAEYLTAIDESAALPNSRHLVAGDRISFDITVPNVLEISSDEPTFVEWSVLTNGDETNPELIFAGGDVIMVHTS